MTESLEKGSLPPDETFAFEERLSDSPLVETVWRTVSSERASFLSTAVTRWEMVVMKHRDTLSLAVRGPETVPTPAESLAGAEYVGIVFRPGSFMPRLPPGAVRDRNEESLPESRNGRFHLAGSSWEFPDFENADTFVARLLRQEVLVSDPVVADILRGDETQLSLRSTQRRFTRATGLTRSAFYGIERAQYARSLLMEGAAILDAVDEAGYYDQPHLTRSLKRFMGVTPADVLLQTRPSLMP